MVTGEHFSTIAENLLKYQERGFLCDAVLVARCGKEVRAHAALLAAVSPVLMTALETAPNAGPHHLFFPDIEVEVLQIAVNFIYTGKLLLPTIYSQMDQLTKLFTKMNELGLNLQKLHGCEMTFLRKVKSEIEEENAEESLSKGEHNYHRSSRTVRRKTRASRAAAENHVKTSSHDTDVDISLGTDEPNYGENKNLKNTSDSNIPSVAKTSDELESRRSPTEENRSDLPKSQTLFDDLCLPENITSVDRLSQPIINKIKEDVDLVSNKINLPISCATDCVDDVVLNSDCTEDLGELVKHSVLHEEEELDEALVDEGIYGYVCEFCDENDRVEFKTESELSRHKTKCHWDECHRCKTCRRKFCSQKGLRTHMKLHLAVSLPPAQRRKKFKCPECDRLYYTAAALEGHRSSHTGKKPWECKICGQGFTMRSSLERHQHLHSGYKPFLCDFCGKAFVQMWYLSEHMVSAHRDADQEYECSRCSQRFKHKSEMEKHALEAHQLTQLEELNTMVKQPEAYLCDFCGKNLLSPKALKMHMKLHSAKRPKCETCSKTFSSYSALHMHRKIHTGEKPYMCEICQKCFRQKPAYVSHLATHSRVRPYVCIVCSKSFANKSQLTQHMIIHSEDKSYACGICNKHFSTKSYFTLHNRIHTGDKPYICTVCGTAFTVKHHLKRHMRVHTGEKPFPCQICGKRYKNSIDLRHHYTRFHKLDYEKISINNRSKYIFKLDDVQLDPAISIQDSEINPELSMSSSCDFNS